MSAFLVSHSHIDQLVAAAIEHHRHHYLTFYHEGECHKVDATNADETGRMLWIENLFSITYRYDDLADAQDGFPGPIGLTRTDVATYAYKRPRLDDMLSPVAVLKAIHCYEYQSCEHPEWNASAAHAFTRALLHDVISRLPGYAEAEWGS